MLKHISKFGVITVVSKIKKPVDFRIEVMLKSLSITKISIGNNVVLKVNVYRFGGMLND